MADKSIFDDELKPVRRVFWIGFVAGALFSLLIGLLNR
jgi:hypothetical protein